MRLEKCKTIQYPHSFFYIHIFEILSCTLTHTLHADISRHLVAANAVQAHMLLAVERGAASSLSDKFAATPTHICTTICMWAWDYTHPTTHVLVEVHRFVSQLSGRTNNAKAYFKLLPLQMPYLTLFVSSSSSLLALCRGHL